MGDPVYSRVGTALQDSFLYLGQDAARTPVTGKVQANFTMRLSKDGAGNQSLTAITITEVDSVHNPGEYTLAIGATAFPAVAGHYVLRIDDTTNTQFNWLWNFWITADGTASGTIGPALFTPAIGNGRVTSGGVALSGALVTIRTAAGVTYATFTSDTSGLWGPVNFPSGSATYTVYVNRTGYSQTTGTITTAGSSAVGPGADLSVTVASTTTGFLAQDLWAYARRSARNAAGTQSNIEVVQAVQDAMERLACSHRWNWYRRYAQLQIHAAYTTGTITLTNGSSSVTLTGGTLPAWAAITDDVAVVKLKVNNQTIALASANVGAGTFVLEAPWMEPTQSGSGYVLYCDEYVLPVNMYQFGKVLPGQRWGWGSTPIGGDQLDDFQNATTYGQKVADFFTIRQQNIVLSSYPTQDILLRYSYYARPANLVNTTDIADWDPAHLRVLHRVIDVEIAILYGGTEGAATYNEVLARYREALGDAMAHDRSESWEASVLGGNSMSKGVLDWKRRNGNG